MTTPYGITTSIGSQTFAGFVNAPVNGPISNYEHPNAVPKHNLGTLWGIKPSPPQFYPSQEPVSSNMFVNARNHYIRAIALTQAEKMRQDVVGKASRPVVHTDYSSRHRVPVSSHVNYIQPLTGDMHINILKSTAIGKSAYKVGLPVAAPISSKGIDTSIRNSSLRRARSGGCTAPRKKGSVYNTSLTQSGINGWGAIARQNA